MRNRVWNLILILAVLALGACAPLNAAQPAVQPQAAEVPRSDPTVTDETQSLTNETADGTALRVEKEERPAAGHQPAGTLFHTLLVLQSQNAGPGSWPAVWSVQADGSGLVKLAEGTFLAGWDG